MGAQGDVTAGEQWPGLGHGVISGRERPWVPEGRGADRLGCQWLQQSAQALLGGGRACGWGPGGRG